MKEVRTCELRAQAPAGAEGMILTGTPIVYEQPTIIHDPAGEFTEIIRRGALDGADLSDVRLFYNHDINRVPLARTPRTMTLEQILAVAQSYVPPKKLEETLSELRKV